MLRTLRLTDFRSYEAREWSFDERVTVFTGPNGAGKSNILEAIFFLGLLRSFRTNRLRELIRAGARRAVIEAELEMRGWRDSYRVEYDAEGRRQLWIADVPVSRTSEFVRAVQPVIFAPEDRALVTGNAAGRRRFFDMLIALIEPEYWAALANYNQALLRRNAAIRGGNAEVARAFEPQMAEYAALVAERRGYYTARLGDAVQRRTGANPFALRYEPDYPRDREGYLSFFERNRKRETRMGFTLFGPQLDDFKISFNELAARSYASTGQGRRLAILLKLAAVELLRAANGDGGKLLVLVDDVTGDLDAENRAAFLTEIAGADQLFFTFTAPPPDTFFAGQKIIPVP